MANAYRVGRHVTSGLATNNVTVFVQPDQNTTGVVIRTGSLYTTYGSVALFIEKTAPANWAAGQHPIFMVTTTSTGQCENVTLPYPLYVDPGFGVYLVGSDTNGGGAITYDFVDGLENA